MAGAQPAGAIIPDGSRRCPQLDARVRGGRGRSGVQSCPRALPADGRDLELFRILWGLWHFFVIRADLAKAQELSAEVAQLGRAAPGPIPCAARPSDPRRDLSLVRRVRRGAARVRRNVCVAGLPPPKQIPGVQDPLVMCGSWLALALWHLGYPDQALARRGRRRSKRAKDSAHSGDLGAALIFAAWVRLLRREHQKRTRVRRDGPPVQRGARPRLPRGAQRDPARLSPGR